MNLFLEYNKKISNLLKELKDKNLIILPENPKSLTVELPPKGNHAHISCNAAMILSKVNQKSPFEMANLLKENFLSHFREFDNIDIGKPGFLNINFKSYFWKNFLDQLILSSSDYGKNYYKKLSFNIEFVSANPTGPLHVGHCRGAILGDVLSNLLKFNGHKVTKEYYVNDYGNQIRNFVLSVYYRILEVVKKKPFPDKKDLYPGDYILVIAKNIIKKKSLSNFTNFEDIEEKLTTLSLEESMKMIKTNLKNLGIKHDNFINESDLIKNDLVSKTIKKLENKNYVYTGKLDPPKGELTKNWKKRNQLLFNSTNFGDDVDRALQKEDKTWTYFAGDIAYHEHKINRKFDTLINILGADHAGYIKRIKAAVNAISDNKTNIVCKVSQLVKLLKKGKPFKMSKRQGDYITVEDLINEVGKDSVRFMMLNRSNDAELDFDFERVSEKSKDNPVFYVQYAYARINSIYRALNLKLEDRIELKNKNLSINSYEMEILKKISEWPKCLEVTSIKLEPHRIPFYLYDLCTLFHSYWNLGKENKEFRFVRNKDDLKMERLVLLQALSIVIRNGMSILGVSTPNSM